METTIKRIEEKMKKVFAKIEKDEREYKGIVSELYKELVKKTKIINNLQKKYEKQ